jgi:SAM-dependent methyltransferase
LFIGGGEPPLNDIRAALRCYRRAGLPIRFFTFVRHLLAPLERVAANVPSTGRILDLGCGHGLFTNLLAVGNPGREVIGVDPSSEKVAVARQSSSELPNVRYIEGRINDVTDGPFDAIAILDVLYLLPDDEKLDVLRRCRALLAPGGVLLLKTNDTQPRWKYTIVRLEEEVMVRALRLTYGGQIHFRGIPEYLELLRAAGFDASVREIDGWRPAPHRLYICRPAITASLPQQSTSV